MKRFNSKLLAASFSLTLSCSAFATGTGGKDEPPQNKSSDGDLKIEIIISDIKQWLKIK